jgi:lipase maturation factor 1
VSVARRVFLRLLGFVYLIAFASLAVQIQGLVGERGIMPAAPFLGWAHSVYGAEAYRLLPTLFWLNASDAALQAGAWTGAGLGLLLMLGFRPRLLLVLLWLLYLSLSVAGQDFLSFQWDALLLEAGLLAVLWAPHTFPRRPSPAPVLLVHDLPDPADHAPAFDPARLLLVFLLFKLMFLSGATKLLSGDPTWRQATALDFHFQTQPLPPWTAWYAHHWPAWLHQGLTWFTLAVELVVPWLLLLPVRWRRFRLGAVGAIAMLQAGIAATGNYGFFNLLTLVLCIPVLDGTPMLKLAPRREDADEAVGRGVAPAWAGVPAALLLGLSVLSLTREIAYTLPQGRGAWYPTWGDRVMGWVDPFRSVNGYGLFRVMTTRRPELVLEGSRDSVQWDPYEFRYKPGDPMRRPGFVAPFHPRLDWQLWFAALGPGQSLGWLQALGERLRAGTPEVVGLLARNPFATAPPRYVRAVLYDYRFTTAEERRRTGAWWVRSLEGTFLLAPAAPEPAGP